VACYFLCDLRWKNMTSALPRESQTTEASALEN
jgi:hypothetical protein